MKKKTLAWKPALLVLWLTFWCSAVPALAEAPEIGGWLQTGIIVSGEPAGAQEGGVTTLRLNLTQSAENVTFKAALDLTDRFGSSALFPGNPSTPDLTYTLKQASLRLDLPAGYLWLGRDNLSLGTARSFSLFEPYSPSAPWIMGGEKAPADFWYLQQNFGRNHRLGFAQVFTSGANPGGVKVLRYNRLLSSGEASLIWVTDPNRGREIYGLDLFGQWGIGYWLSAAQTRLTASDNPAAQYVAGADYTLPLGNGLYLSAEYFYDGTGGTSFSQYDQTALINKDRATLATRYLAVRERYGINDFWSQEAALYNNLDDGGIIISPRLSYLFNQDTEIILSADLIQADAGTEFNPPGGIRKDKYYLIIKKSF